MTMIHPRTILGLSARPAIIGLALVGSMAAAGCGNAGEGSITISPEARARVRGQVKDKKGQPVANQGKSAKELVRQKAESGSP